MVLSHLISSVFCRGSEYLFKVLQQDIPVRALTVCLQFTQPDSLVPPEWKHGTGPPGNSPNVVVKIMIYMTCTSGTQLLEINQNGDETEGYKKPAQ